MQTNYRAELYAVKVDILRCRIARRYIDNEAVVEGLQRLQLFGWQNMFWDKHAERKRWYSVWSLWQHKHPKKWNVARVRVHRDMSIARTYQEVWLIFHNHNADRAAKQANAKSQQKLHSLALREYSRVAGMADNMFRLQSNVLTLATGSQRVPSQAPVPQPQLVTVRFQQEFFTFPPQELQLHGLLQCPRFVHVLHHWLQGEWAPVPIGFSVAEMYLCFVADTGWATPVNVGTWQKGRLPVRWQCNVPAAWLHETDYNALLLCRPSFFKQLTISFMP